MLALPDETDGPGRKASLVDDAYRALKEAIRENTFPPGYQGSEQEIATRLGMSRTPVHEAVIRLQEEGLVRVLARRGVIVCGISAADMREIYEVVVALEGIAAERLALKPDDERLPIVAELESAVCDMEAALASDDLTAWARADESFHRLLIERCGNKRLARMFLTVMDQAHRARMLTLRLRPRPTGSALEHGAIVAAIARGDAADAQEKASRHRLRARDALLPLIERLGMRNL